MSNDAFQILLEDVCEHSGQEGRQFSSSPMTPKGGVLTGYAILGYIASRGIDAPGVKSMAGYWIGQTRDRWPTLLWCPETIIASAGGKFRLHPLVAKIMTMPSSIPGFIPKGEKWAPPADVVRQITRQAGNIWRNRTFVS